MTDDATLTTTTPAGVSTTRPVAPSWASVAPLLARWQMALIPHDDLSWDVFSGYTPIPRLPIHDARRVPFAALPQAIADVAARCEADAAAAEPPAAGGGGGMSLIRDILIILEAERREHVVFDVADYELVMDPATYHTLMTEPLDLQERGLLQRHPCQPTRVAGVLIVLGQVPEDWGWMLRWKGTHQPTAEPPDASAGEGER